MAWRLHQFILRRRGALIQAAILAAAIAGLWIEARAGELPGSEYFDEITLWAANPSREAALTMQESSFRPRAKSPWARGLRQTTPDTEEWLEWHLCRDLGPARPYHPLWSLECGIRYVEWLQPERFDDYCENRRFAEQAYNGGPGWIKWELDAGGGVFTAAEALCGAVVLPNGRRRSRRSCEENYAYPARIDEWQRAYAGVMPGTVCAGVLILDGE